MIRDSLDSSWAPIQVVPQGGRSRVWAEDMTSLTQRQLRWGLQLKRCRLLCTVPVGLRVIARHCRLIYHIRLDRAVPGNQEMLMLAPRQPA